MILNSITLHNFMSYGDAQLDLSSVSVACLAGPNGAGKSALLDACTWAIWEEARSTSDELVRLGAQEMWVDIRFQHEGQVYRIRRSRHKTVGKGGSKGLSKGHLDFQVFQNTDNGWKSLTGAGTRETQRLILQLLRMDYDTFVNSAYLKQGRADEFTTRNAEKRKQVLADILGLSYFDRMQEQCKERGRDLKQKKEWLQQSLLELLPTEAQLQELDSEHLDKESLWQQAFREKSKWEAVVNELSEKTNRLLSLADKIEVGDRQVIADKEDIRALITQIAELNKRLAAIDGLTNNRAKIEAEVGDYEVLRQQLEQMDKNTLALQELTNKKVEARSDLVNLRTRLDLEHQQIKEKLELSSARQDKLLSELEEAGRIAQTHAEYRQLLASETLLAKKQESFTQLSQRITQLGSQIEAASVRLESDLQQKTANRLDLQALLNSKPMLDQQKSSIEKERDELDKLETEFELTRERGQEASLTIETVKTKIEQLKHSQIEYREKIAELESSANSAHCPLCAGPIADRKAVIDRYHHFIDEANRHITQLTNDSLEKENIRVELRRRYKELDESLKARKQLDTRIGQYNEKLSLLKRSQDNLEKLASEIEFLQAKIENKDYAQVERESLTALKNELHELGFDPVLYSNLQAQIRAQRSIESRYHQLQKDLEESARLEKEIPDLKLKLNQLKTTLSEESYGREERAQLKVIEDEISQLNYDRIAHETLKAKLQELMPFLDEYRELKKALADEPSIKDALAQAQKRFDTKSKQVIELEANLKIWRADIEQLPSAQDETSKIRQLLLATQSEYDQLSKELAVLADRQNQLKTKLAELTGKKQTLTEIETKVKDYAVLVEALGKKGIQAVIIENTIPEIETEANRILSRLSENNMHIALVTQQTNKSGNVVETLEIVIADEVGTRNYELYSGGEAFKVNFALRVALSRLLARRAGAKLETLIIDEGFGSQDELSRDRLVKAIRSIQGDFARILVITHFADVKEMFPTHILVSKQDGLSTVELSA